MAEATVLNATAWIYCLSAATLAVWLVLGGVPVIPVICGVGIGAAIMVRLGTIIESRTHHH